MLRRTPLAVMAVVAALLPAAAAAQEATTTRIETRAFYGATVTLEAGVRVFRPLPPHSKVIINPGGTTPLYLGHEEHRSTSHNYNYNYDQSSNAADHGSYGGTNYGGGFDAGRRAYNYGAPRFHAPRHAGPKHHPVHAGGRAHTGNFDRSGGHTMHGGGHAGGGQGGGGKH